MVAPLSTERKRSVNIVNQEVAQLERRSPQPDSSIPVPTTAATDKGPKAKSNRVRRAVYIGIAVVIAGGVTWWEAGGNDRFVPKRFGVVVPGKIYRSGQISKWLIEDVLLRHEIQVIVDFTGFDWNDEFQQHELSVAWKHKIAVNRYAQSGDGTGDIKNYAVALKVIRDCELAGKPVLVHCAAGSQRTGAAIAFYRVLVQRQSPEEAVREMRRYDCDPEDNGRLITYINSHMEELAKLLMELKVIKEMPREIPQLKV